MVVTMGWMVLNNPWGVTRDLPTRLYRWALPRSSSSSLRAVVGFLAWRINKKEEGVAGG